MAKAERETGTTDVVPTEGVKYPRKTERRVNHSLLDMTRSDYDGPSIISTFDAGDIDGLKKILAARGKPTYSLDDVLEDGFNVVEWVCETATYRDTATDEERTGARITFFDPENRTLACGAESVMRCFEAIRSMLGDGPYNPPLPLTFAVQKLNRGRRVYNVNLR